MNAVLRRVSSPAGYVGACALFAAAGYYFIYRDFNSVVQGLLGLAVLTLALYAWGAREAVLCALTSRQTRRGSNSLVMLLAFVGIVGLLNFLAARHTYRWDLTDTGIYSLSPQTLQVLGNLENPVRVIGFFTLQGDYQRQAAEDLLKEYAARSDKISYEFVDIDQRPALAQQYQIRSEGLLFLSGDRRQHVQGTTESDFTNALLKISSDEQKTVAFVVGHGERATDGYDDAAYRRAKSALEADNYNVTTVSLTAGSIPADTDAVVLADPRSPLLEQERQVLRDYLKQGGKLMLLYEPGVDAQLDDLLLDYGVSLGRDLVVDPARAFFGDAGTPVIVQYGWSAITKDLPQTIFPGTAALTPPQDSAQGTTVTPLALTSENSWAEKDTSSPRFDEGTDAKGPLTIALTVESEVNAQEQPEGEESQGDEPQRKSRVVVVGDSDFASDAFIGLVGNLDFFVNSVNWLTEDEGLISIRPKPPESHPIVLTPSQQNLVFLTSVVLVPLLVLVAGGWVWWSRR